MKAFQIKKLVLFGTTLLAASMLSCSKGASTNDTTTVVAIATPDGSGSNSASWSSGQTVDFSPTSFTVFNSYVGTHPLNDPSGFKININLNQVDGQLLFGGQIKIGYSDSGSWYEGIFNTGVGTNVKCENCKDNGQYEAKFNYFYNASGKKVFTGFFQDRYGGIVLVLEPATGSGDGDGGTYKGSVFYKNFAQALSTESPYRKCWFIYAGPYQCGSTAVTSKSSYTSIDGYTKLGTFTGIDLTLVQN